MKFRFVEVSHGELASGRPLVFGDVVDLTKAEQEEPATARLITRGALVPSAPEKSPAPPEAPDPEEKT